MLYIHIFISGLIYMQVAIALVLFPQATKSHLEASLPLLNKTRHLRWPDEAWYLLSLYDDTSKLRYPVQRYAILLPITSSQQSHLSFVIEPHTLRLNAALLFSV